MSRTFRYQEIAEALREEIGTGRFDEGVLPSEADLAAEYEASRVTVRKALEQLRGDGLVSSRQGFGWFVEANPVRQSLDSLATIEAQLVEAGRSAERVVMSFGFVAPPQRVAVLLGGEVLEVVRLTLADDEPFALVTVWCSAAVGAGLSRDDVERSTFVDLLGPRLATATQVISAAAADREAAAVLGAELGDPLLVIRRVTSDQAGIAVLVSEHRYLAGSTEFEVTLEQSGGDPTRLRLIGG